MIWFFFRVAPVLVAICSIYYVYRARDLREMYIYIINTVLEINQTNLYNNNNILYNILLVCLLL